MQNFILIVLIAGLAFFLYLIGIGEIDSNTFNIKKYTASSMFIVKKLDSISLKNSEVLQLDIKGNIFDIFTSTDTEFKRIPRSEYYMKIYDVPLDAKDAMTAVWLGSRYVFYVIEEPIDESKTNIMYRVYRTEYPTDSIEPVEYRLLKSIRSEDLNNAIDVRY